MRHIFSGAIALSFFTSPALAHHPLAGQPMETFMHGLLSGVGHPVLGFDHLFFVAVVGILALYTSYARLSPAVYILAMLAGCLMMNAGIGLPMKEFVIGASLLVLGGIILSGRTPGSVSVFVLFAVFGMFHGSAFGDTLAEQESAVGGVILIGYLVGLGVIQYVLAIAAGLLVQWLSGVEKSIGVNARIAGAVVAGMGLFLTLENIESTVFSVMGIAV